MAVIFISGTALSVTVNALRNNAIGSHRNNRASPVLYARERERERKSRNSSRREIVDRRKSAHTRHSTVPCTRQPVLPTWMRSDTRIDTKPAVGCAVPRARNYSKSLGPLCRLRWTFSGKERKRERERGLPVSLIVPFQRIAAVVTLPHCIDKTDKRGT